jgi:type IV pilus assembly protein PilB
VASAIGCIVAQRLARTLCVHCKSKQTIAKEILVDNGFMVEEDIETWGAVGCARCGMSGYKGRVGLYEVMLVTEEVRELAIERASAERIREVAIRQGMRLLRDDGLDKIRQGLTSVTEVARVTGTGATDEVESAW